MSTTLDALVVPDALLPTIHELNATMRNVRLVPIRSADGRYFLPKDLLTDCGPGQTWERFSALLHTLSTETVTLKEYPED